MTDNNFPTTAQPNSSIEEIVLNEKQDHQVQLQGVVYHKRPIKAAGVYFLTVAILSGLTAPAPTLGLIVCVLALISLYQDLSGHSNQGWIRSLLLKDKGHNGIVWTSDRLPTSEQWVANSNPKIVVGINASDAAKLRHASLSKLLMMLACLILFSSVAFSYLGDAKTSVLHSALAGFFAFAIFGLKNTVKDANPNLASTAKAWLKWMKDKQIEGAVLLTEGGFNGEASRVFLQNHKRFLPTGSTLYVHYMDGDGAINVSLDGEPSESTPRWPGLSSIRKSGFKTASCSGNLEDLVNLEKIEFPIDELPVSTETDTTEEAVENAP